MSGLFGGRPSNIETPKLATIPLQTSAWGLPIPIVYGTTRVPGNLIGLYDFTAIQQTQHVGGKGGGGSADQVSYVYTVVPLLAMAEGPIVGINTVWGDKEKKTLSYYGFTLKTGDRNQTALGYLTTNHPTEAYPYSGTAYVAATPLALGSSGTLKNFSFEVQGFFIFGSGSGPQDAHPADIIPDFLTNAYYGAGWSAARLAALSVGQDGTLASSYRQYCTAMGFFLSPAFTDQRAAKDHLQDLLDATNAGAVFSQGTLKIFPFGDVAATGNSVTFTPVTAPYYDLTPDDFLSRGPGEDLVTVTRVPQADCFNTVPVEYLDRANDYNVTVVQDPEPADADQYGQRIGPTKALHCIAQQATALAISRLMAQRQIAIRNTYQFRLGWRYILLDPMDLVTITDPALGLDHVTVRIREIVEDEDGGLTVTAEEWPFGTASPTIYTTQSSAGGTVPNTAVDPGNATTPALVVVPGLYPGDGSLQLLIATAGGANWGGAEVWVSSDGTSYSQIGTITQKARYGVTTSVLAAAPGGVPGFDTTNTVGVDLTVSGGSLVTVTDANALALQTLCVIGGEWGAFATATLTGTNLYTLSRLVRGAYGTALTSEASGSTFVRVDSAVFFYPVPKSLWGTTLYVKLVSFNIYGGGVQSLASVSASTVAVPSAPTFPAPSSPTFTVT